jgi:ribosomal protein S18 acetylase RimI-like enzyme
LSHINQFRKATTADVEAIAKLVNNAYRPNSGISGWTHESDLVVGDRTDISQIIEILSKKDSVILIGLDGETIVACAHVEKNNCSSYIGMLAVDPILQGVGAGKNMLAYAEQYAQDNFNPDKFVMAVVSGRHELISFYQRRGYQKTGETMEYPVNTGVGQPKLDNLKVEILEKQTGR